jgi:hypothetical protein
MVSDHKSSVNNSAPTPAMALPLVAYLWETEMRRRFVANDAALAVVEAGVARFRSLCEQVTGRKFPDSPTPSPTPARPDGCPRCGATETSIRWHEFRDRTLHLRLECSGCGRFIRNVAKSPENVEIANKVAPHPGGQGGGR